MSQTKPTPNFSGSIIIIIVIIIFAWLFGRGSAINLQENHGNNESADKQTEFSNPIEINYLLSEEFKQL
ncbi:MAG: hypothetical protein ABIH21_03520, partial [Patescibacteria group bacterium]